jgi:hypothetical protein
VDSVLRPQRVASRTGGSGLAGHHDAVLTTRCGGSSQIIHDEQIAAVASATYAAVVEASGGPAPASRVGLLARWHASGNDARSTPSRCPRAIRSSGDIVAAHAPVAQPILDEQWQKV